MKAPLDIIMWLFITLVVVAAIRNSKGFARDVSAVGGEVTGFSGTILKGAGSS